MANTYTSLHYHVIFSTKRRERWLTPAIQERVWAYLGGIARENGLRPLLIGGVEDHVHVLLGIPPAITVPGSMLTNSFGIAKVSKKGRLETTYCC